MGHDVNEARPDGLVKIYVSNIQGLGGGLKIPKIKSRTLDSELIILNETNKFVEDDLQVGCRFGRVSNTPNPDRSGPDFGTFLGTKRFDANKGDEWWQHDKFELLLCLRHFQNFSIALLGMYRSPSMDAQTCDDFYDALDKAVELFRPRCDILVIAGDDNSHDDQKSGSKARRAFNRLEDVRFKYDGKHIVKENTRKNHQTDHVLAFYDDANFSILGAVLPGLGDHDEMLIEISSQIIRPDSPKWFRKEIVVDEGDPILIQMHLQSKLSSINPDWIKQNYEHEGKLSSQAVCDQIFRYFRDTISEVRTKCRKVIYRNLPEGPGPLKSREERRVQLLENKIFACRAKIDKNQSDTSQRAKLSKLVTEHKLASEIVAQKILEKDMSKMTRNRYHDSRRFFQATGKMIKSDQLEHSLSQAEIDAKIEAAEANYKLQGPELSRGDFIHIESDAIFSISYDVGEIVSAILEAKKIDNFYKTHAKTIAPAFSVI